MHIQGNMHMYVLEVHNNNILLSSSFGHVTPQHITLINIVEKNG